MGTVSMFIYLSIYLRESIYLFLEEKRQKQKRKPEKLKKRT